MEYQEIIDIHKRLDDRAQMRVARKVDSNQDDNSIAQLANQQGWEVLKTSIESMIAELLVPVDFEDNTPLDVRGAIAEARKFGIEIAKRIINIVEVTKAAKQDAKPVIKDKGISE